MPRGVMATLLTLTQAFLVRVQTGQQKVYSALMEKLNEEDLQLIEQMLGQPKENIEAFIELFSLEEEPNG
jgi:hypothetical protein